MISKAHDPADAAKTGRFALRAREIAAVKARILAEETALHAEAYAFTVEQTERLRDASTKEREMPLRAMAAEIGAATRESDRVLQSRLFEAHRAVTLFPASYDALREGRISQRHLAVIVERGAELEDPEARSAYESDVLAYAETTTAARTRTFAEQVAEKHDPKTIQERHDAAALTRRVWVEDLRDGMAMLGAIGPVTEIHGIHDRLTRQARAIRDADRAARRTVDPPAEDPVTARSAPGGAAADAAGSPRRDIGVDERGIDQIRTDVLMDMLLTAAPTIDPIGDTVEGGLGAIRAHVQLTVPASTLAGTTSGGAQLDGACAVDPETAKVLAGHAPGFDRVFLDPITGAVLSVDRRHITSAQKRYLLARDVHCRFPGCRRPARECDWDHRKDHAHGGRTDVDNVGAFCRRHHTLKHATPWTVTQRPGGTLHFIAPSGLRHIEKPPPRVMFSPDPPGPTRTSAPPAAPF
ncbi:HNH endonuclease signature motif containing protein [Microbacterium xanthum]|uniref:HNH endonuclease signature motif containing protein n=1 Tax=Microbacterium xanthum TaxID=3079794 RepID=UPI002AD34A51|nr:DUF222 domain-containing protein [Microbacterium sp. KSW-48]MDZ8171397.1 DUF222 domain-containing protein [Microbacterium sp. KSW-48]